MNLPLFFKSQTQGILQHQRLIASNWTEVWIMFFTPKSDHLLFSNPNTGIFGECYCSCWSQNGWDAERNKWKVTSKNTTDRVLCAGKPGTTQFLLSIMHFPKPSLDGKALDFSFLSKHHEQFPSAYLLLQISGVSMVKQEAACFWSF